MLQLTKVAMGNWVLALAHHALLLAPPMALVGSLTPVALGGWGAGGGVPSQPLGGVPRGEGHELDLINISYMDMKTLQWGANVKRRRGERDF
jgi:hypothetical protein